MPVSTFLALNATVGASTTIAAGSNGVSLPTGTINVASTTGFSASGKILVTTGAGIQVVTYTGTTGTTFTGCTGGTGAMATGGAVNTGSQVKTYTNATPTLQGQIFGGLSTGTGSIGAATNVNRCSVVNYQGYQTFFAIVGTSIYKSTDAGATWTAVRTLSTMTSQVLHAGLRVCSTGGQTQIFVMYQGSANFTVDYSTDGGTTWSSVNAVTIGGNTFSDAIFWNGKFYTMWYSTSVGNNTFAVWDPSAHAISTGTGSGTTFPAGSNAAIGPVRLCAFNGNLYAIGEAGGNYSLYVWGSNWTVAASNFRASTVNQSAYPELFAQGGFMWAITQSSTTWRCDKFDTSLTVTASNTAIPAAFSAAAARVFAVADSAQGMGSEPQIYIYYSPDGTSTTNWSCYQWNGGSSVMTLVESGGAAQDSMNFVKWSGGDGFWQSGNDKVEIISRTGVAGGVQYTFKLYSSSGTDVVSLRGWYSTNTQSYAYSHATLINPSSGSVSGQNIISLTADNSTSYTVTWASVTDGIANGANYGFFLEQF
jgi:hypothetical protein